MDAAAGGGAGTDDEVERPSGPPGPDSLTARVGDLCRQMTDHPSVDGAGCLLLDADGALRTVAVSGVLARSLAAAEELTDDGPCHDALGLGREAVGPVELTSWPHLATLLAGGPLRTVVTAPVTREHTGIGVFFVVSEREHPGSDRSLAAAIGSVAARIADAVGMELDVALEAVADDPDELDDEVVRELAHWLANRSKLEQAVDLIGRQTGSSTNRSGRRLRQLAQAMDVPAVIIAQRIVTQGRLPHPHEFLADASERSHREELARLALSDPLTGLANRVLLLDRLEHAVWRSHRGAGRPAVLFIDLDGFKLVNDMLGHDIGDHVLRTAAARIQASVRPQDTVGRMGGDEFAVVCEAVDGAPTAVAIARRIASAVEEPITLEQSSGHRARALPASASVGASIGVAVAAPGQSAKDVLRSADAAMYRSKSGSACITVCDDPTPSHRRGTPG
jgi:diguanylate cyclase (GGDEF)-like protein